MRPTTSNRNNKNARRTGRIPAAGKLKLGTANIDVRASYRNLFAGAVSPSGDGHVDTI